MSTENLLLVFIKNPALGKVKTRLAKTMGDEQALHVYHHLLAHTHSIAKKVDTDKAVFYSDFIDDNDFWKEAGFKQFIQEGNDLGDKMAFAFKKAFALGYKQVVIIGSDCFELNETILQDAFYVLEDNKVVIGPAKDGGYYLLGMSNYYEPLFKNKVWSTALVLPDTLNNISNLNLSYKLLPELSDIDVEEDLVNYQNILKS